MSHPSSQSPKGAGASADSGDHLNPGSLIFAKMKSFPPWPAKVISADEFPGSIPRYQVPVLFLGSGDYGHVASKDCFPYLEYRNQYGTPKKQAKHAEAIREADELCNQKSRKRPLHSPSPAAQESKASSTASSPSKRPRGRPPKVKRVETEAESGKASADQIEQSGNEVEQSQWSAPANQEVVVLPDSTPATGVHPGAGVGDDDYIDDGISNVVQQLEELEKQDNEPHQDHLEGDTMDSSSATAPKRRGRPARARTTSGMSPVSTPAVEHAGASPTQRLQQRSLSETTDDGRGNAAGQGGHSSGGETPSAEGPDAGRLGKRRHKPKIMSDYFLEYDYASPRTHRKSESSSATTPMTPPAQPHPTKAQQQKTLKLAPVERTVKYAASRGRKSGPSGGASKSTKEMEKAALEEEIERVKMAAEQNEGGEQQQGTSSDQLWQRHDAFSDLPFDDSMFDAGAFEVTVDVEETPSGGHSSFAQDSAAQTAAAKRRKDAEELAKEKERQKQKPKLKVKLLKGLLPAPKNLAAGPSGATAEAKKKKGKTSSLDLAKKHMGVGKMKVQLAKKRAMKAAKVVAAAADMKVKKKRGRPPSLFKPVSESGRRVSESGRRVSGFDLWSEHEKDIILEQHPDLKTMKDIRELLQANWKQLTDNERKTWKLLAKREKERRGQSGNGSGLVKTKGQPTPSSSAGGSGMAVQPTGEVKRGRGRPKGSGTSSPKRPTPSSPRIARSVGMSPAHGMVDMSQLQQFSDQTSSFTGSYLQSTDPSFAGTAYGNTTAGSTSLHGGFGISDQEYSPQPSLVAPPPPMKRPRGRPPKHPRPPAPQQQYAVESQRSVELGSPQEGQSSASYMGYQMVQQLPKGLKIPKKESARKAQKTPLKILSADQRRPPFQARSPPAYIQQQGDHAFMSGGLDEPPVPEAMSHEELVYDSEAAAMAAAAEAGMDMEAGGIMADDGLGEVSYGHMDEQRAHQPVELGEETAAAVSFLTGDQSQMNQQKTKAQLDEERAARKRESRRRSRARQRALKEQRKLESAQVQAKPQAPQRPQKNREQQAFANEQGAYGDQSAPLDSPAAYEVAYVEPQPSEDETNMFFFGTPQDVQSLLEMRNPPGAMEGMCRWWLQDEIDPELQGIKKGGLRGLSPPRGLTAEPLDAAAVFKLIGRSFENVGNQLMREDNEDSPHEVAAGMDMLLDTLVGSVTHLLTLTGAVPPFDRRYRGDVLSRLVEETAMMIPL